MEHLKVNLVPYELIWMVQRTKFWNGVFFLQVDTETFGKRPPYHNIRTKPQSLVKRAMIDCNLNFSL